MVALSSESCPRVRHIVSGTFNTARLHLLAFDSLTKTLVLTRSIDAQGPHQFLALGAGSSSTHPAGSSTLWRTLYATTWATPPSLSAWSVIGLDHQSGGSIKAAQSVDLRWINTVTITATSSYVHVQPPPFLANTAPSFGKTPGTAMFLYSAGGPTGEVHAIRSGNGALVDDRKQELCFLPGGTDALKDAEKGRKALRYGAHSIDVSIDNLVFVADLGRNAILTYARDDQNGSMNLLSETKSPRQGDGPRHVVPSPDGRWAFSVTEHTSFVDVFEVVDKPRGQLQYRLSLDLLPSGVDRECFRGDTVRLSPSGREIFASTRGKRPETRGWVAAWNFDSVTANTATLNPWTERSEEHLLFRWETPTSGGKANAIEWAPRYGADEAAALRHDSASSGDGGDQDWIVLTDDAEGGIFVLEWNGKDLIEVARTRLPGKGDPKLGEGTHEGASHAIWLT